MNLKTAYVMVLLLSISRKQVNPPVKELIR